MKTSLNLFRLTLSLVVIMFISCEQKPVEPPLPSHEVVALWADMSCYVMKNTPANSPTYASRTAGYIGLTMYESIVQGVDSHQSVGEGLNDFPALPAPEEGQTYNWDQVLNAASASIIKGVYNQTSDVNKQKIDSLAMMIHKRQEVNNADKQIGERSKNYGQQVAKQIFEWSKTDGGHRAYLNNFDKDFEHPTHLGAWQPPLYAQSISHHPLHPHWGSNRTFLKVNDSLPLPVMIAFDSLPDSEYYQQYMAVYEQDRQLTQEQKEIAIWWGDDPSDTFTPPGHSFYLASIAVRNKQPDLIGAAETYARVGLAVADAFINCWIWKYHFFSERPNTFIPKYIDQSWESFWPDPPFPAFPSGHAIQASAAATVLEDLYGAEFEFTDNSHVGRERDELRDVDFKARSFTTFWGFARETADSRFYGGIHTPQDNDVGLEEGKKIAQNVNALNWRKP